MTWSFAVPDWRDRLRAGRSLVPDLPLDVELAEKGAKVFDCLRLADVQGTPPMRVAVGDWFRDIVRAVIGSYDRQARVRHIREIFLMVPKKNSKTTNGALLFLTALLLNERPRARFLFLAETQSISQLAFDQAAGAIALDPALEKLCHVQTHTKSITVRKTGARLEIKSFSPEVTTGQKPVGVMIDEVHTLGHVAYADRVIRQLRGGLISQPEGFLMFTTTQSEAPPAGVFKAELKRARAVRDGVEAGSLLPVLYEFPEDILASRPGADGLYAWEDPRLWPMVTPNAGRSLQIPRLVEDYRAEKAKGLDALRGWASQHLNIEIGQTLAADNWAGAEFWESAAEPALTLDALLARVDVVVVGIDGGGLDDLLGLVVLGRERGTGKWLAWAHAWAHAIVFERRKDIASRLADFIAEGSLTVVRRPGDDVDAVADLVARLADEGLLAEKYAIGVDAAGITDIADALVARDIALDRIVAVSQGWKLNGAIKTTERKVAGGDLVHGGSALMAWCVGNAKTELKGNALTITKQASGSAKIDPLMALFDAVTLMGANPQPAERSFYEEAA